MKPETRDLKEKLLLMDVYGPMIVRCAGRHLVVDGYACPHCESANPQEYCTKEKVGEKPPKEKP